MTDEQIPRRGESVRGFFAIESDLMYRRFKAFETLVPARKRSGSAHSGDEGRFIEALLRDFLNRHLPRNLRAYSGFIYRAATKTGERSYSRLRDADMYSSQIDVIVYDHAMYPVYEQFGEVIVAPPEGVVGLVSIKKRLRQRDLKPELNALSNAVELCSECHARFPMTSLFAFTADGQRETARWSKPIYEAIKTVSQGHRFSAAVNEVSVLDQFTVFKYAPDAAPPNSARFVMVDSPPDTMAQRVSHIALQRMLQSIMSVYYARTGVRLQRPGYVSFPKNTFRDAPDIGVIDVLGDDVRVKHPTGRRLL